MHSFLLLLLCAVAAASELGYITVLKRGSSEADHALLHSRLPGRRFHIGSFRAVHSLESVDLSDFPFVDYVVPNTLKHIVGDALTNLTCDDSMGPNPTISWNQERLTTRYPPRDGPTGLTGTYVYDKDWVADVDIYSMDTGIRLTHEEFQGRAVWGQQFAPGAIGTDQQGHGTIVAGIAAGARYGILKNVRIIAVKVCGDTGGCSDADIVAGIEWSVENSKRTGRRGVGSISISGLATSGGDPTTAAVNAAAEEGFLCAVAAGNDNRDACLNGPGQAEDGLTIASTQWSRQVGSDYEDRRASSSNYGPCVSMFAPGVQITSAGWQRVGASDTAYYVSSGTSMAAPHGAAVAAVGLQLNPSFSAYELKAWVLEQAVPGVVVGAGTGSPNLMANLPCL